MIEPLGYLDRREGPAAFGVIDPSGPGGARFVRAFGTDAVELQSGRIHGHDHPYFRIKVAAPSDRQFRGACRDMASGLGIAEALACFEVLYGQGLALPAARVFVCPDPAIGRDYFARRSAGEGGGDG